MVCQTRLCLKCYYWLQVHFLRVVYTEAVRCTVNFWCMCHIYWLAAHFQGCPCWRHLRRYFFNFHELTVVTVSRKESVQSSVVEHSNTHSWWLVISCNHWWLLDSFLYSFSLTRLQSTCAMIFRHSSIVLHTRILSSDWYWDINHMEIQNLGFI